LSGFWWRTLYITTLCQNLLSLTLEEVGYENKSIYHKLSNANVCVARCMRVCVCMIVSADYSHYSDGNEWTSMCVLNIFFPLLPLAFSQSYVNSYTFMVQIHVQRDRVTEVFPYFVSLIWFSDCDSGSQSIDACSRF